MSWTQRPRPSRRRPRRRPEVIKEATAAAPEVIRETVPEVIKETVAAAAAVEPDVVVDEGDARLQLRRDVHGLRVARTRNLHRHRVAAVWGARGGARGAASAAAAADAGRRLMASMGDVPPTNAQTWHAPAKEKTANGPRRAHLRRRWHVD